MILFFFVFSPPNNDFGSYWSKQWILKLSQLNFTFSYVNKNRIVSFFFLTHNSHMILQAQDFRQQGTKIRRKMWFQNMKIKLIVLGIIIAIILIIVLSVCGGFNCSKWVFPLWLQLCQSVSSLEKIFASWLSLPLLSTQCFWLLGFTFFLHIL